MGIELHIGMGITKDMIFLYKDLVLYKKLYIFTLQP